MVVIGNEVERSGWVWERSEWIEEFDLIEFYDWLFIGDKLRRIIMVSVFGVDGVFYWDIEYGGFMV